MSDDWGAGDKLIEAKPSVGDPKAPADLKVPAARSDFGGGDRPVAEPAFQPPAETSAPGIVGAVTRGLAPIATGAALGAAAGAPIGGVGAIPGAALGAGSMAATQVVSSIYNSVAGQMNCPKMATPQEMTDRLLDAFGTKRASTDVERVLESTAGGAASGMGLGRTAGAIAERAINPTVKGVSEQLARGLPTQAVSGASSGAAGQTAAEMGADPAEQFVYAMLAGGVPYLPSSARAMISAEPRAAALDARQAGYVLPPSHMSEKPGIVSNILSGWSGKVKTQQAASVKNQTVTNDLAAKALGLPEGTILNDSILNDIRDVAGRAYQDVAQATPVISSDPVYAIKVASLGNVNSQAAQMFPKIVKNQAIQDLVEELKSVQHFPTATGLELVKELRFNGNANLKAFADPSKRALGMAQREAADAVDELMERNITAAGNPDAIQEYRAARRLIAKSYDVEGAMNPATGDVDARHLAKLATRGRPLTGELDTIAQAANAFPKAFQSPSRFGFEEAHSAIDTIGAGASLLHGHPGVAATFLGRPLARSTILSKRYQNNMAGQGPPTPGIGPLILPATSSDDVLRNVPQ